MAFTYTWANILTQVQDLQKGMSFGGNEVTYCDKVGSAIYNYRPWFWKLTTIAGGTIPLVDGTQDYSVPANVNRITNLYLKRTDVTPAATRELDIAQDLAVDLVPRSPYAIRCAGLQAGVGLIRLEAAVAIPTGTAWEIDGIFKINYARVAATTDTLWFPDHYAQVPVEGLLYWSYRRADDSRAGTAQRAENGRTVYTGQLAVFMEALNAMAKDQDDQGIQSVFPENTLGRGRDSWSGPNIFGVF